MVSFKSIMDKNTYASMLARIDKLDPQSQALWGKMDVAQMLAHCQQPIRVATGELKLKRSFMGILFGRMFKKKFLAQKSAFPKNTPTDPAFKMVNPMDFEKEKQGLLSLLDKLVKGGYDGITKEDHPFFGPMTPTEWGELTSIHLDHHLRQFGV
jgi:uncharacterized protein YqcC (DUF446 family)